MNNKGKALNEWGAATAPTTPERTCRICGCTDSKACEGGCSWATPGICTKCIFERVPECIDLLVEVILEIHQAEIDAGHHGDETCSTCDLIKVARTIKKALRQ